MNAVTDLEANRPKPILRIEKLRRYFRTGRAPRTIVGGEMGFLTTGKACSRLDKSVSADEFARTLRQQFADELMYETTSGFADRRPQESSRSPVSRGIIGRLLLVVSICSGCFLFAPRTAFAVLVVAASICFLLVAG